MSPSQQKASADHWDSDGLGWTWMDSDGLGWTRMDMDGHGWTRMDSDGPLALASPSKTSTGAFV